jgi:tight adherence protein B
MPWAVAAVLLLSLVGGGALFGALIMTRRSRLAMEHRVVLVAAAPKTLTADAAGMSLKTRSDEFDLRLRRFFAVGADHSWGMKAGAPGLATAAIATGAAIWILTHMALDLSSWVVVPVTALAAFASPRVILLRQQKKADSQFIDLFPAAVDTIARMLRAGLPITSAVHSVSTEAPPPVNEVFTMVANQIEIGAPIEEALDTASQQIALADFRFFTVAVALQHATGGNLAATLEILSDIIRKRRAVRLKAKATTAEIRVSAYVLGSLPILIVGALLLIQPGYLTPLFRDPRGHVIVAIAAGLLLLAAVSMRQMMRSVTN